MDIQAIRQDFPILKRSVNNNPLIYFDNAATTQKPRQVIDAIRDFYENHNANVHRAVHTLSLEATDLYEKSREKISKFVNAKEPSEIVFVRGTTEAVNLVAYSWGLSNLGRGDEVLVSLMEHHSNIVPWEITGKLKGFTIKYADVKADGTLDYDDFESKFSPKTKIACLSHVSNVTGVINDVKRIAKAARDNGALMLVDGAQSVPHLPVDVQDLDVDFLAFSGHKMLGPTGIGVLYGRKEVLEEMPPFQGGGEMIKEVDFSQAKGCSIIWNDLPWKFEAGTPNVCGAIGLAEAVKYLQGIGMDNLLSYEKDLTTYAVERMRECSKITVYGPSDLSKKCGIIPFTVKDLSSHDVALICDNYGIMIRSGYHCAQPLHEDILKIHSSDRASFYVYNTREEVDRFVEVLKEIEQL
ncbi:MAG TPA: cysteine desulfurase [Candidatus Limnocylindrales bacterium]|nr:cysteine desulfurase [Candidatus Limnocylindrales bacterium]